MWALTFDKTREDWTHSTGLVKEQVKAPDLNGPFDQSNVIIKVKYAGFCGSDRGIWWRRAFGDMILNSLTASNSDKRIVGHELLGEIVEVGSKVRAKYGYKLGDTVTTESHIVCGVCYQCRLGQMHVCEKNTIIGISQDGCFAEYLKLPAKALWPTDLNRIRPEVAAVQEPFGNAVHACSVTDLSGKSVAILGTGTIGLFAVLIARGMGAQQIIAVEPDPHHQSLARRLGCTDIISPVTHPSDPWRSDPKTIEAVRDLTRGKGVDVAMEMSGFHSSLNNAIHITRPGGDVVLFGVRDGEATIESAQQLVMKGLTLHGVVGRRLFQTWHRTRHLLENHSNGIQDAIWEVILNRGSGSMVHIDNWERDAFEQTIRAFPKPIIQFS